MREAELIKKLREMIRGENDQETIVVFMQTIAELERQRRRRMFDVEQRD
jgi:hypothetical protein